MEVAVKKVVDLALSDDVKKTINLWFPTGRLSAIFLDNCQAEMMFQDVPIQTDMNINIYIEKE
jgi:hypothetical protein